MVWLHSSGPPDAPEAGEVFHLHARNAGLSPETFDVAMVEGTLLKRLPRLTKVANVAVLMASECASVITDAVANVTCGEIVD